MKLIDNQYIAATIYTKKKKVTYFDFLSRAFNTFVIKAIKDQIKQNKQQDLKFLKFRKQGEKVIQSIPTFAFRYKSTEIYLNLQLFLVCIRSITFPFNVNVWFIRHWKLSRR